MSLLYVTQCILNQTKNHTEIATKVDQLLFDEQSLINSVSLPLLIQIQDLWKNDSSVNRVLDEPAKLFSQYVHDCNENLMYYWMNDLLPRLIHHLEQNEQLDKFPYNQLDYIFSNTKVEQTEAELRIGKKGEEILYVTSVDKLTNETQISSDSSVVFVVDLSVYTRSEARVKLDIQIIISNLQLVMQKISEKKSVHVLFTNVDHFYTLLQEYSIYRSPAAMIKLPPSGIDYRIPQYKYKILFNKKTVTIDKSKVKTLVNELSPVTIANICSYMNNASDVVRFGSVNQNTRRAIENDVIWKNLTIYHKSYTMTENQVECEYNQSGATSWKKFYVSKANDLHTKALEFMQQLILSEHKQSETLHVYTVNLLDQHSLKNTLERIITHVTRNNI
jgi:hypothetical protein